jgi:PilZ domain
VREESARYTCEKLSGSLPLCSTLLTESSEEKIRHQAILLALSETGGKFNSRTKVVPGETVGIILHPDLRYAIRGRVTWVRQMKDDVNVNFGVTFEEEIPESLWDILGRTVAA